MEADRYIERQIDRQGARYIDRYIDTIQNWPHPAEFGTIHEVEGHEETSIQVYTDGRKQEQGVGSGAVIFKGSEMIANYNLNQIIDAGTIRQNNLPYSKH